tara:strand:- start:771 stop:2243 length:1473 start_codon:yes stop_codon:yes gene_type:complete
MKIRLKTLTAAIGAITLGAALTSPTMASSHREAPFLTGMPKVDGTDFYMFRSYEDGREDYVTIVANYQPLQDAYGGPNYFDLQDNALYEIHLDQNGDAIEDLTFSFQFFTELQDIALNIEGNSVSVPLKNIGQIGPDVGDTGSLNVKQKYSITQIEGDRRQGTRTSVLNQLDDSSMFARPADNIGTKSIPDYEAYAAAHINDVMIPGCATSGKVFVGQRQDPFVVNLGEIFDLVNLNPLGAPDARPNVIADKNVTSIVMELPISCITNGSEPVIGAWTTASIRQAQIINPYPNYDNGQGSSVVGGAWTQVSRLGMPLVNEVVIGLKDKDRFNTSEPKDDGQFATYVTHPTMPELLEILFPGTAVAPNLFPRTDLVSAFLTGVSGVNQPANVVGSEMLRLNTSIAPTVAAEQNNLGVLGGDLAGFPNGRRPGDDVVDSVLRVAMGALIADEEVAPNRTAPLTDGATVSAQDFTTQFPYLISPIPGAGQAVE